MDQHFAIIDLGSNSVRLVMYRQDETGTIQEIDNIKSVLRLSSRMNEAGELEKKGIEKLVTCMKRFRSFCRARGVETIYGIATAAIRGAANRSAIIEMIEKETGIQFRVLTGKEEAYYGYLAVINTLDYQEAITVDIGGGSTEITYFKDRTLQYSHSFPFGVVTLNQKFGQNVPAILSYVTKLLEEQSWIRGKSCPVIAMGGTARNLARIEQRKNNYSLSSVHNYRMKRNQIAVILDWISSIPVDERKEVNGLSKDRADILPTGLSVFLAVLDSVQTDQLVTSNKGLRDGFLFEKLFSDYPNSMVPDILDYSTKQFMDRYRVLKEHAEHVKKLSLLLFDSLKELGCHHWGTRERRLLQTAALLHNIGRSINIIESTKHTFYLIQNVLLLGVSHRERLIIGLAASYKNNRQLQFHAAMHADILTKEDEKIASELGTIISLGKSMDRNFTQTIERVELAGGKKKIQVKLQVSINSDIEWMMEDIEESFKKAGKVFGVSFAIKE